MHFRLLYIIVYTLIGSLLLMSCEDISPDKSQLQSNINDPVESYNQRYDVAYGPHPFHNMDIHLPVSPYRNPAEVIIMIHGGNWTQGEKWFLQPSADSLMKAKKNLAIVNINYRLAAEQGQTLFETQMADIDSLVTHLQRNAKKYNIREDAFAIMGGSAGSHLALCFAYKDTQRRIHTVIGMSSITELATKELSNPAIWHDIQVVAGENFGSIEKKLLKAASPVYLAHSEAPRTLLLYGRQDDVVHERQQTLLLERLQALKIPTALYIFPDENHNISPPKVANGILAALGANEFNTYLKDMSY